MCRGCLFARLLELSAHARLPRLEFLQRFVLFLDISHYEVRVSLQAHSIYSWLPPSTIHLLFVLPPCHPPDSVPITVVSTSRKYTRKTYSSMIIGPQFLSCLPYHLLQLRQMVRSIPLLRISSGTHDPLQMTRRSGIRESPLRRCPSRSWGTNNEVGRFKTGMCGTRRL